MKLPSMQTDLQAVPEQPEKENAVLQELQWPTLTEAGEQSQEAEDNKGNYDQQEVGGITRIRFV